MTINGDGISESGTPLLDDFVPASVDFKGRPSVRSKSGSWKSSVFIISVGVTERFAYYGIGANSVIYLTGKLGQSTASAAASLNAWFGTAAVVPIFGAFVADSFFGRFRMIIVSCVLYIVGLGFMVLSASFSSHASSECKAIAGNIHTSCSPNNLQIMFFFVSFYLAALAQGGYAPCVQAFGADQFDEDDENECKAKSSFFNWWYCFSVGGIVVPLLALTYIQDYVSWELGFGIPALFMCFSLVVFLMGSTRYRFRVYTDKRNPIVRIYRVFVEAAKNWHTAVPVVSSIEEEGQLIMPRKDSQFKFLDKALLAPNGLIDDEKSCSVGDVEDAKSILKLAPFWCSCLGHTIIFAQPSTLFTKQASTLDRHIISGIEVPAASLQQLFIAAFIVISLSSYDRILVPVARAITKKPSGITMLQRTGTGLVLSLISIVFAAVVERKRLATAREFGLLDDPTVILPMSMWWLAPQYILGGIADTFTLVGLQEFFYDQVPTELKSMGLALYLSILGVGSFISSFLVSSIQNATKGNGQGGWFADNLNRAHLDYFYWLLAGISALGLGSFIYFSRSYTYTKRIVFS